MAKIGTAHVEIKPVLNEVALDALVQRIEDAIEAGVTRALDAANRRPLWGDVHIGTTTGTRFDQTRNCPCRPENGGSGICGCTLGGPTITC